MCCPSTVGITLFRLYRICTVGIVFSVAARAWWSEGTRRGVAPTALKRRRSWRYRSDRRTIRRIPSAPSKGRQAPSAEAGSNGRRRRQPCSTAEAAVEAAGRDNRDRRPEDWRLRPGPNRRRTAKQEPSSVFCPSSAYFETRPEKNKSQHRIFISSKLNNIQRWYKG